MPTRTELIRGMPALVAGFFMRGRMAGMKRFSIRDLIWLTLLVAILLAWWLDHRTISARNRFTVETVSLPDREPTVLRDTVTGQILHKEGDVWQIGVKQVD